MKIASEHFNPYAQAVEEAQGDIRVWVQRAFLYRMPQREVDRELKKIIDAATNGIEIDRLKTDIRISLINFANKQRMLWQSTLLTPEEILFLGVAISNSNPPSPPRTFRVVLSNGEELNYATHMKGVPLQRYYQDVWKERVSPVLDRIARDNALDPNDFKKRNSLRNLAEMEVRYQDHQDSIESLKNSGIKLVACSSHADCSKRCARYQGRIYSLNGTSGTIDGHKYVPLERATQNPEDSHTTQAGRTYQNGLLGFNCRHYLTEYKGQLLPTVSAEERKREYAITQKQRRMESEVRKEKAKALCNKPLNKNAYREHQREAQKLYDEYKKFCGDNNRAYYPMRVRI